MEVKSIIRFFLYPGLWATIFFCQAQPGMDLRFDYITVDDELSHSDVTYIVQDTLGYVWFGTNSGLNRYDGRNLRVFKHDFSNDQGLPDNRITVLYLDSTGKLWIGTENGGLCWYDYVHDRFVEVALPTHLTIRNNISVIREDEYNRLWVGTRYDGLFRLREIDGEVYAKHFFMQEDCGHCLAGNEVLALFPVGNDEMWVSTNKGLNVISNDSVAPLTLQGDILEDRVVKCFFKKNELEYFLGTGSGLLRFSPAKGVEEVYKARLSGLDIRDIYRDKDDRLWLATFNNGIAILEKEGYIHTLEQNLEQPGQSINYNRVNDIFEDSFGTLWIGTSGGGANYTSVYRLPFHHISKRPNKANQIISNYVTALEEMPGGILWVGTRKGMSVVNLSTGESTNFSVTPGAKGLAGRIVSAFLQDSRSGKWVLTRDGGLSRVFGRDNNLGFETISGSHPGWPKDDYIGMAEDDFGRLWVATFNSGIVIFHPATGHIDHLQAEEGSHGLPTDLLTSVYKDPYSNTLWLGSRDQGLIEVKIVDKQAYVIYNHKREKDNESSLSWNYVWPVIVAKDSTVWVGTIGGGLNKMLRNEKGKAVFKRYDVRDGLPSNDVESIQIDEQGDLWIGGYGITRFDPGREEFENFNVKDGLQSNSFKIGASCKGPAGTLYFGGINGLNYFNPTDISRHQVPPNIVLTNLYLDNKKVEVHDNNGLLETDLAHTSLIHLQGDANDFRVDFDVINTDPSSPVEVEYALKGYFEGWRQLAMNQSGFDLSNLPTGKYELKIKTARSSLPVDEVGTMLTIIKHPPWWRSYQAIVIYVILIALSYILVRGITIWQMSMIQDLTLANEQKELSLSKIQFFTNISHELRTPLSLILGPLEDIIYKRLQPSQIRSSVQIIHKNVQRLMTLINMLLDFRKIENGQMNLILVEEDIGSFIKEIFLVFKAKAEEKHIHFTLDLPDKPLTILFDKLKIEIVIINLLSNAFKFTKPYGMVKVILEPVGNIENDSVYDKANQLIDNYLSIRVKDNGIGISAKELRHIFDRYYQARKLETLSMVGSGIGLSFSRDIIALHKGNIEVESKEGRGAEFQIKLPVGNAHLGDQHVVVEQVQDFEQNDHHDLEGSTFFNDYIKDIDREGINILLVDDNPDILQYLGSSLGEYYTVVTAKNGHDGYLQLQKHPIHLIMCDVMMPVMDGIEFTKRVKNSPEYRHIPIVLLTAKTAAIDEIKGLVAGADDYISKPFSMRLLLARLESLLNRQRQIQDHYRGLMGMIDIGDDQKGIDHDFINRAIRVIDNNSENELFNVNTLANELAMSRSALYKKIKENTNKSSVEFIREIKLSKAVQLLKSRKFTVNEVASKVGFKDIKYFRECFKKQFGSSPLEYVKASKNKTDLNRR